MKVKPIYIYLGAFIVFITAVIFFSNTVKNSTQSNLSQSNKEMPDDQIHRGMSKEGGEELPNKSNVMEEAKAKLKALKEEVEKNPNDTIKVKEYAGIVQAHEPDEAIKLYERILKAGPKRKDILLELTFLYYNKGDISKAEAYNNKVLSLDKNDLLANYNTGGLAQAKGDIKKAKEIWAGISKKYPNTQIGQIAGELVKQIEQLPKK
jgi:tetratricopeptide (TPR) repeat protein